MERLVANHYLDLKHWEPVRTWPPAQPVIATPDHVPALIDCVADRIATTLSLVASASPIVMNLTAGRDSRMVLACARTIADRLFLGTARLPGKAAAIDCNIASMLARRHRLNHVIREWLDPSPEDLSEWLYRTGYCVAGGTWRTVRTTREFAMLTPLRLRDWAAKLGGRTIGMIVMSPML